MHLSKFQKARYRHDQKQKGLTKHALPNHAETHGNVVLYPKTLITHNGTSIFCCVVGAENHNTRLYISEKNAAMTSIKSIE